MCLSFCNTITAFYNSTLYTTIPHSKQKHRLKELVQMCFMKKRMANVDTNTFAMFGGRIFQPATYI
jgi:hypothetical protein